MIESSKYVFCTYKDPESSDTSETTFIRFKGHKDVGGMGAGLLNVSWMSNELPGGNPERPSEVSGGYTNSS